MLYGSAQNHLSSWKYPTMDKVKELDGHRICFLYITVNIELFCIISDAIHYVHDETNF